MSERNELTEQEWELLEMVAEILTSEEATEQQTDQFYNFCLQLANTVPKADEGFRKRLEIRLSAEFERQRQKKVGTVEDNLQREVHHAYNEAAPYQLIQRSWRRLKSLVVWAVAGIIVMTVLLVISPRVRSVAAQAIGEIRQVLVGVLTGPDRMPALEPTPPFKLKQPGYLPEGFEWTIGYYYLGPSSQTQQYRRPSLREEHVLPKLSTDVATQWTMERNRVSEPHVVLMYEAHNGQYIRLFERAARPNEVLPPGETSTIAGQTAKLQRSGKTLILIWIDEGTWIELQGTLQEAEMLKVAVGLRTTQAPKAANGLTDEDMEVHSSVALFDLPFCDPNQRPPSWPKLEFLLGELSGQQNKGSVIIELTYYDVVGESESVSYSANDENIEDVRKDVLEPALIALQNPTIPMQQLSYSSLSFVSSGDEACLRPNPLVQGFIVIEVWDKQVNIGYGGDGRQLKEHAIEALQRELQRLP